ncbi:hypothetical protein [Crossiella sp. CA198]|uniref:hypothetical protein n=1 Tax=Crossiella sp. CA198 TaxID=3455607 RepID=UPI003F8CFCE1
MSDAILVALIALAGTTVAAVPAYVAVRRSRRLVHEQGTAITGAVSTLEGALAPLNARLDGLSSQLTAVGADVTDLRISVAVHDDRWTRGRMPVEVRTLEGER